MPSFTRSRSFILPLSILLLLFQIARADKIPRDSTIERLILMNRRYVNLPPTGSTNSDSIAPLMKIYPGISKMKLKGDAAYILGHYYQYLSDSEMALDYLQQSASLYKKANEWGLYLNVTKDFYNIERLTGNIKNIESELKKCLEISKTHAVGFYILDPLQELTVHYSFTENKPKEAIRYGRMFMDTLRKYRRMKINNPDFEYSKTVDAKIVEMEMGCSYLELGEVDKAEYFLGVARKFFGTKTAPARMARIYRNLAILAAYRNQKDSMISYLKKSDQYVNRRTAATANALLKLPKIKRDLQSANQAYAESKKEVEQLARQNYLIVAFFIATVALTSLIFWTQIQSKKSHTKINELLRRDFERSQKLNEEKTKYFSILSHELRTPIFAITGLAKLLEEPVNNTKENIEAIINSGNHLLHLVNNVLQHNKLEESARVTLDEADFELVHTLKEVLQTTSYLASQKNIEVTFNNSLEGPQYIFGDKQKLTQILVNLISNAIRYSHRDGQVDVSVSLREAGDRKRTFRFSIEDQGIGIEPSQLPLVFDYRKTTYDSQSDDLDNLKGMGIGLFVVANFIKAMGSDIFVESLPGEKTNFYFDLRLKEGKQVPMPTETVPKTNRDVNILVVDDIKINLIVTQKTFTTIGIRCFTATDADPVVEIIQNQNIDLVLMDLNMPLISGYDLSKKIRQAGIAIPIIAHTAVIKENIDYSALEDAEIHDYLIKPYPIEDLKEKLTKYLSISF